VRRDSAVGADLDDAIRCAGGVDHCPALGDGMANWLFDVNMRAGFYRGYCA